MEKAVILWADDEIDLLKPHVLFLEQKGFEVHTANNGSDALNMLNSIETDIVFLDEQMPGISGLETLTKIKTRFPALPVVMITKSEEEFIMDDAIGSKISDYLIKPVHPNQIILCIKKQLKGKELISEKSTSRYRQAFIEINSRLSAQLVIDDWFSIYKDLVYWTMELQDGGEHAMEDILNGQKKDANRIFGKFIRSNYLNWIHGSADAPLLSHQLMTKKVLPVLDQEKVFLIVIDNLRFDQWRVLRKQLEPLFRIESEEHYLSILPTATQYARNALFAGMMPLDIESKYPKWWKYEQDEGGKNLFEEELLNAFFTSKGKQVRMHYNKITNLDQGKKLVGQFANLMDADLNVVVYNFVDMLSHARTEMEIIKELARDEAAYRSITASWFAHSPLYEMMQQVSEAGIRVILTTDHGSVYAQTPCKIIGDKNTNSNLRYKMGGNLKFSEKDVFAIRKPEDAGLPRSAINSIFMFAMEDKYFVYQNNYNHYVNYFQGTFQHGGISMEEMMIPLISLCPR